MRDSWPARLWIVRHGESAGNLARTYAREQGHSAIELPGRDADVPLSALGHEQASALGRWFATLSAEERPNTLLSSPYLRTRQTADGLRSAGALAPGAAPMALDERLREREFGLLEGLTGKGIREQYPREAELRRMLGKFYYRPPGGESWCDVILRLRSALDTIALHYAGGNVLVVTHQVVVLCLRYLLEQLDEHQILAIDREADFANCGVAEYVYDPGADSGARMRLHRYNFVAPLEAAGAPITAEPDPAPAE